MKPWIAGALGICGGALIVLGYDAIGLRASQLRRFVAQVAHSTGQPAPARRAHPPAEAQSPPPGVVERPQLPDYLQKRLEHWLEREPGSKFTRFHAEMEREGRDPTWAPATEYQMQLLLRERAPELLGRIRLYRTTCASSMCEMVGVLTDPDPELMSKDMTDWQQLLYQAPALASWQATGLGSPSDVTIMTGSDGPPAFIVHFRKAPAVTNKSLARRGPVNRA